MVMRVSARQKLRQWAAVLVGLFSAGVVSASDGYVPTVPTPYSANTIVCIGDSLTGGEKACEKVSSSAFPANYCPDVFGNGTYKDVFLTYPVYLAERVGSGFTVENFARGGAETEQMLGLLTPGGASIKSDMTIGPTTTVVEFNGVGLFVGGTDSNTPQLPLPEAYSVGNCRLVGDLGGVVRVRYGQSSRSRSAFVFVDGPKSDVVVPAGATFTSDASLMCSNAIQVIFLGANNGVSGYSTWVNLIRDYVQNRVTSGKYVVVSPFNTTSVTNLRSDALEAYMAALFGKHYVNLYAELNTNGMARAKAKGYVAASSTAAWNSANGLLSTDDLHFNDTGKRVMADIVYDKLVSLGYLSGGSGSGDTPAHVHSWDAGTVTKAATATEDGVKTYHCTGCDETKTEAIPATGGDDDDLTLTEPVRGATVTTHHPDMETFIRKDLAGRCEQWQMDATQLTVEQPELSTAEFKALVPCKDQFNPYPITFAWSDGTAPFRVTVKRASDGKVFVDQSGITKRSAVLYHSLEIGRDWIWTVTDATGATGSSRFTTDAQPPRVVNGGGKVDNVRDFGGWYGLGGKRIRQGIIYRGGEMEGATQTDRDTLVGLLNIRTDIDLRAPTTNTPPFEAYGVAYTNVEHNGYDLMLPSAKNPVPSTRRAFEVLAAATAERAAVVHCIYGRDRTGCIGGLVLGLLGVSEDDIYNDYMCSDARTRERFHGIYNMIASLKKDYPADTLAESVARYFKATGVTDGQIEAFRAKMIEGYAAHDHTWSAWATVAEPTLGVAGKRRRYCTECNETQEEAIPALDLADTATPIAGGWSNMVTIAQTDYCVLAFTNAATAGHAWTVPSGVTAIDYLAVGGGGAGGALQGGGGGAGGFLRFSCAVTAGNALRITVGAGGKSGSGRGGNGGDSVVYDETAGADVLRAFGGGGGGTLTETAASGAAGGSGGGASAYATDVTGGAGASGQGYAGGVGLNGAASGGGAGGGGAGGVGGNVKCYNEAKVSGICGGSGGSGVACDFTGSTVRYAGGGGGGGTSTENSSPTHGALTTDGGMACDGGGSGGTSRMPAKAGTDGLGGGGGGGGAENLTDGANGGSGIVVIRYAVSAGGDEPGGDEPGGDEPGGDTPDPSDFKSEWGYSETLTDGSTVLVFTNTAATMNWQVPSDVTSVRYLVVAGGGGGGMGKTKSGGRAGAGGGAGGFLTGAWPVTGSTVQIVVGAGGAAASADSGAEQNGSNGGNSAFGEIVALGGGGGSGACTGDGGAKSGGSGGGGTTTAGAAGAAGQGCAGGMGGLGATGNSGGGGGGAGGVGGTVDAAGATAYPGGAGGAGATSDICGTEATYACGGAGGGHTSETPVQLDCAGSGGNGYHLVNVDDKVSVAPNPGCDGVVILRFTTGGVPPAHEHVYGDWTTVTAATCTEPGLEQRSCMASGCTTPVATETRGVAALGHDLGAWYTNVAAQVGVAGELRRDCRRTGCDYFETQAIAPLDPLPSGSLSVVAPANAQTVDLLTENQRNYLALEGEQLRTALRMKDSDYKKEHPELSGDAYAIDVTPSPLTLRWQGSVGVCTVEVVRVSNGEVFLRETSSTGALDVYNLEVGCAYRWRVTDSTGCCEATFTTSAQAPRLLNGGAVANLRDLGGWKGLYGCPIRQGRIFRSGEMNTRDKSGAIVSYITDENRAVFADVMQLKSDVDLRNEDETLGMTESALGPDVTWFNCYLSPYYKPRSEQADSLRFLLCPTNHPADFHCAAGKDRTGTEAAFVLGLLGVSDADILRDFGFIDAEVHTPRLESMMNSLKQDYGVDTFAEACDKYFVKGLGCTTEQVEAFRYALLEDYPGGGCPKHVHEWSDWVTNAVAGVGVAGERQHTCRTCEKTEVEIIPSLPDPDALLNAAWGYEVAQTDGSHVLVFTNTAYAMDWPVPTGVTNVRYLVVAGGGAGGDRAGGGGGAGGLLAGDALAVTPGGTLAVVVGKGGVHANGGDSAIGSDIVAIGGGQGGYATSDAAGMCGKSGGSGGGSNGWTTKSAIPGTAIGEGLGYGGGTGWGRNGGGGGGGAGGAGGNVLCNNLDKTGAVGGLGGIGFESDITGGTVAYAGGGGGGGNVAENLNPPASGGEAATNGGRAVAGGGQGGTDKTPATDGTDGLGGGGGGGGYNGTMTGGRGGDGVVILRFVMGETPTDEKKPTVGGQDVEPGTVFTVANSQQPIVYPSAPVVTGEVGAQQIAFGGTAVEVPRYYTATPDGNTVSLALNGFAKPAIAADTTAGEEKEAFVLVDGNVALHLENVYPTLYYTLERTAQLGAAADWTAVETMQGKADFTTKQTGDSACYRITVRDTP